MIDELDTISINRSTNSDSGCDGEVGRITVTLMQELDKLPNDVICLAATNRIDRIDKTILRRFTLKHQIETFNREETKKLLTLFTSSVGYEFSENTIESIVAASKNQAETINLAINEIARQISDDIESTNA